MKSFQQSTRMIPLALLAGVLLLAPAAAAQKKNPTLAVLDFENITRQQALDWLGTGIAETLTTDLSRVRQLTLIERKRLHDALKELKFGRSQYVDSDSAQKIGKVLGADYMVVGGYQPFQEDLRLTARLVDVETAKILAPTRVDGKFTDLFKLQTQLAENLVKEIRGTFAEEEKGLMEAPTSNLDAFRHFSDGAYYFRNDLVKEAVASLDAALNLDPRYSLAHFYKGLALQKLGRWDDSVRSFKQALLGAGGEAREKWVWEVPYEKPGSKRGLRTVLDIAQFEKLIRGEQEELKLPDFRDVIYLETVGKTCVLHIVDPQRRTARRLVLPDPGVIEFGGPFAFGTNKIALIDAYRRGLAGLSEWDLYAVDLEEGVQAWRWHWEGELFPFGLQATSKTVYFFFGAADLVVALDLAAGQERWRKTVRLTRRPGTIFFPSVHGDVPGVGELLTLSTSKGLLILRGQDGAELSQIEGDPRNWTIQVSGKTILVLEPKTKAIIAYDVTSGQKQFEIPLEVLGRRYQGAVAILPGDAPFVPSAVRDEVLYVPSTDGYLYALAVGDKPAGANRVLWKTPIAEKPILVGPWGGIVYLSSENGHLYILDASNGKVQIETRLGNSLVGPVYIRSDFGVVLSRNRLFGLDLRTGETKWEHVVGRSEVIATYVQGMIVFQSGKKEITAVDAQTGEVLWQHLAEKSPLVLPGKRSVFIADLKGVTEYVSPKPTEDDSLDKAEVLTQLALSQLELGQLEEANFTAQKVVRDLDPDHPEAHYALARIYRQRKEPRNSLRELMAYYRLVRPTSQQARDVVQELKQNFNLVWRAEVETAERLHGDDLGKLALLEGERGWLYALDLSSGQFAWRHKAPHLLDSVVSESAQKVYLLSRAGEESNTLQIWQMDASTGERKQITTLNVPHSLSSAELFTAPERLLLHLNLAENAGERRLSQTLCLDRATGKTIWEKTRPLEKDARVVLAANDTSPYVIQWIGNALHVLSASDGKELAQHDAEGPIYSLTSTVRALPDRVFYNLADRGLVAFNARDGKVVWTQDLPEDDYRLRVLRQFTRDSTLYFHTPQTVLALDLSDTPTTPDRIRWRFELPQEMRIERIVLAGPNLYCLRDDDVLLRLDADTGKLISEHALLWDVGDFVVKGETLYALSSDGRAYAMKLAAAEPAAAPEK